MPFVPESREPDRGPSIYQLEGGEVVVRHASREPEPKAKREVEAGPHVLEPAWIAEIATERCNGR